MEWHCSVCGRSARFDKHERCAIAIEAQRAATVKQGAVRSTQARAEGIAQPPTGDPSNG
jgi:hypothetical protein